MARIPESIAISFANTGIITNATPDDIPITAYKMLANAHTDMENSVSVRKGFTRLNAGLPETPYSSYFLRDSNDIKWRYAIANGILYVAPVIDPEDASIWPLALGTDFAAILGGGALSQEIDPRALWATVTLQGTEMRPYALMADGTAFLKHPGGLGVATRIGIPRPISAISGMSKVAVSSSQLEKFEDYTEWAGGDPDLPVAENSPSGWWYGISTLSQRWYYARHSFVLDDESETVASSYGFPKNIVGYKASRMYWKQPDYSYEKLPRFEPSNGWWGFDYDDSTIFGMGAGKIPNGSRVKQVKVRYVKSINFGLFIRPSYICDIQFVYETGDGQIINGPNRYVNGKVGGDLYEFNLDHDEYLIGIKGRYGTTYCQSIRFVTNKRESILYGEIGTGGQDFDFSIPEGDSTKSPAIVGIWGRAHLDDVPYYRVTAWGLVIEWNSYNNADTAPVNAVGWNLYVGSTPESMTRVNSEMISLGTIFDEPAGGFTYSGIYPIVENSGELSDDPSGVVDNALMMSIAGGGKYGSAIKAFTDDDGNPIIKDFGVYDPDESFVISIKFDDADSKDNCAEIRLKFIFSDIPGDTGTQYKYTATASITDFSDFTAGTWKVISISKLQFNLSNFGGQEWADIGWNAVSAVQLEVLTKGSVVGDFECDVSFDELYFAPAGKLNGSNLMWTYTYYNSRTDTESDYADPVSNTLGPLTNDQVQLNIPATPSAAPPAADPDKVRIYRMGGTLVQFQMVGEVDYVAGFPLQWIDSVGDEYAGELLELDNQLPPAEVEGVEVWDNRIWTWGGALNGIREPLNRLRFSKGTRVEHFPSDNYIYVGSGNEEIMRVLEHDGELFVFTVSKIYRIIGQSGDYRAQTTSVNQGVTSKFCVSRGVRGLFFRAPDGIYEFPNGRKISEPIGQIFRGESINGMEPITQSRKSEEAMGFYDGKLYVSYCSTDDHGISNDRMLVWDTIYERWSWRIYGAQNLFYEDETHMLVGCNLTQWYGEIVPGTDDEVRKSGAYPMRLDHGNADEFSDPLSGDLVKYGIPCIIDTKEYDLGYPDQEKQFFELIADADTQGYPVILQASFDGEAHELIGVIQTSTRSRVAYPIIMNEENSRMATRMSVRIIFESDPGAEESARIFKIIHRVLLEPQRHRNYVTDWDYCGYQGPKYIHQMWIEMDTFGHPLNKIEVQVDHQVVMTITDNIMADGRAKFYYGLGVDLRGTIVRIKFFTDGDWEVKVYDYGFEVIPEPPALNTIQTPWTDNGFPYRKLWRHVEMDVDTGGQLIEFTFWLDNEAVQTFQVSTDFRQKVVQSLNQESFGKLGRLTVDMPAVDTDGNPQGVRIYGVPTFVTEKRNPDITIADSWEATLNYERIKSAKQIFYIVENPNADVSMEVLIDNVSRGTFNIPANGDIYPKYLIRRQDFPSAYKGKLFRFVFTSTQPFEIDWPHSRVVTRNVNLEETHGSPNLEPPKTY